MSCTAIARLASTAAGGATRVGSSTADARLATRTSPAGGKTCALRDLHAAFIPKRVAAVRVEIARALFDERYVATRAAMWLTTGVGRRLTTHAGRMTANARPTAGGEEPAANIAAAVASTTGVSASTRPEPATATTATQSAYARLEAPIVAQEFLFIGARTTRRDQPN